ncbi:MAG: ferritin-like domain-containing protein [Acidimicrobiales bacterium]
MDCNQDEVRRQLRAATREQRSSMVGFRAALQRVFSSDDIPTTARAELLGIPGRRRFLKVGGATILGAAVLVACGSEETTAGDTGDPTTSTTASLVPTTAVPDAEAGATLDVVLLRTAASLENLAVAVYGVALGTSSVAELPAEIDFDPIVAGAAELFQEHHQAHADALNASLEDMGEAAYTDPNKYIFDNAVAPKLSGLTDEPAVVRFARDIENVAAGTYSFAAGQLSEPALRSTLMSIGAVEARHATALAMVLDGSGRTGAPIAFTDASPRGRVPDESFLDEEE